MLEDSAGTDAAEGDAVDLVICANTRATVPSTNVLEDAGAVTDVGSTVRVLAARKALDVRA